MKPLRVGILGGGPAGLYAAILLKNANPNNDVLVIERNPAGATYGFGIVVSDKTLTHFQEADPQTFAEISAHQVTWNSIDIYHRSEQLHCGGYFYLGMARKRLLDILLARCEELGVRMTHQQEVADLSAFADRDLIIAADGINSLARRLYAEQFQPTLTPGAGRFIWLAVRYHAPGFTFIFQETEHGVFQAHIYPYDQETSTCIVMCHESTWHKAGLAKLDEASSAAYCKELYRPYLGDVEFLTNRSLWLQFHEVRNERWYHNNIVLVGDAVHTAHWSIGSGAKMAMEDAIALVKSLQQFNRLSDALAHYERERQQVVAKIQRAARISQTYCEHIDRYMHLAPMQFAFQFMVRSGRVDYETLRQKDPTFIDRLEHWYARQAAALTGHPIGEALSPAQSPLRLREVTLANRAVQCATSAPAPLPPGLIMTESELGSTNGDAAERWRQFAAAVHAQPGTRAALQLIIADRIGLQQAAEAAHAAGFDLLLLQAANTGALPALVEAVRAVWPAHKPLGAVLPASGLEGDEAVTLAEAIRPKGCDLIWITPSETSSQSQAAALMISEQVRNLAHIATMIGRPALSRTEADTAVASARADLCIMA